MATEAKRHGGARPGAGRRCATVDRKVRVGVWYCTVHDVSRLNDSKLDCLVAVEPGEENDPKRLCNSADRPYIFDKIKMRQRDPNHSRIDRLDREFNVAERVEGRWPGTNRLLSHPLWDLIATQGPSLAFVQQTIAELLGLIGMRRMGLMATRGVIRAHDEGRRGVDDLADRMPAVIADATSAPSVDWLALLAALALEARTYNDEGRVQRYVAAFHQAANRFARMHVFRLIPQLPEWMLEVSTRFTESFAPAAGERRSEINHLSYVVADNPKSRDMEQVLDEMETIRFARMLELVLELPPELEQTMAGHSHADANARPSSE